MLRNVLQLQGYRLGAQDGEIGHVNAFLVDEKSWAIRHLVVDTGDWLSGRKVLISPDQIERISWEESKVFVNLSKEAVAQAPGDETAAVDTADHVG